MATGYWWYPGAVAALRGQWSAMVIGRGTGKLTSAWRISALVAGDLCKQGMRIQWGGTGESISPEGGILSAEKKVVSLIGSSLANK